MSSSQDRIKFLLFDYCQLSNIHKYDRIISCEILEAIGHEFMEEFFGYCGSMLATTSLLVLQFISIPDERYERYRKSSDFIKEYIFPGGCLPCLCLCIKTLCTSPRRLQNTLLSNTEILAKKFLEQGKNS